MAVEDRDPASLLNRYRRLIHLRGQNGALATGRLVQLIPGGPNVVAYVRRAGDGAVLVVANLARVAAVGVAIDSPKGVLPPGTYAARGLLGGPDGAVLRVGADGGIAGYIPAGAIGAYGSLVLALERR